MTLRTAVVGGGTVSGVHLDGLRKNPRTSLVAICDTDEDTARDIAAEYAIDAYVDVESMLAESDLDWAHRYTSVQTHLSLAKRFIEAGVPVQIEKPITETDEEFEELAAHADRHGVVGSEKHDHNVDPVMRAAIRDAATGHESRESQAVEPTIGRDEK
jgi:predicted dehydrogenase